MVSSVVARDYPVIVALTLVFGAAVVIANLLVDMSYALFDPTIRQ
jgi:ABC-type dipeptide/oligopeptide/nickel transport system permease component